MARLLLVEDNEMSRSMMTRRLHRLGFEVTTALNGREAILKATSARPDLILMDLSLPILDGWSATQAIKADPQTFQIPIIALTAHAMAGDRERALAAGCDEYVTKPVDLPKLLEAIDALLGPEVRL
jgi:CheY-like chemotaxis protein